MSPPSEISPINNKEIQAKAEFSPEERQLLLKASHEAIVSSLQNREISTEAPSPHLAQPRGAFTTLYLNSKLRGCVGYPLAAFPLFQTVVETARSAAFEDPRFLPVTLDEARQIAVSLSVLSPVQPISADQIEVGRHGLIVSLGLRRGLLLPQVPLEHGWDGITFLEQTCRKAGLSLDAWRQGATIEAFTAEVFGDSTCPA
jgi:uncharacterized protein